MTKLSRRVSVLLFAVGGSLSREALAAPFEPGDMLAGVELITEGGPGRVYRVNDGGDFTATAPDFEMPIAAPVIDVCSTDDGRVLIATSTNHTVYDISSGEAVSFATIPSDASALYCGGGQIFVASFLRSSQLFDISAGGDVTEVYASGINRAVVRDPAGSLWAANFTGFASGGGVFRDIEQGSDVTGQTPFAELTDIFSATVFDERVFASAATNDAIVDLSEGIPNFAYALVPGIRGLTASDGELWASTLEGKVYKTTSSLDYTNKTPFATLPGPSLSMAFVQKCGDGEVHGREQCDGGGATDTCSASCRLNRCGDGVVTAGLGETCDDGNLDAGDGCSKHCVLETPSGAGGGGAGGEQSSGGDTAGGGDAGGGANDAPIDDSGCTASASSTRRDGYLALSSLALIALGLQHSTRRRRARQKPSIMASSRPPC